MNKRILIFGKTGLLGSELSKYFKKKNYKVFSYSRKNFDYINNTNLLISKLEKVKPDFILNAAAITDEKICKKNKKLCYLTNTYFPEKLGMIAKKNKYVLIHFSTDDIFNNKKKRLNLIQDIPNPSSLYGRTKLLSEIKLKKNKFAIILRLPHVFSLKKKGFFKNMDIKLKKGKKIFLHNYFFSPILLSDICAFINKMIKNKIFFEYISKKKVIHLSNSIRISRFDFFKSLYKKKKYQKLIFKSKKIKINDYSKVNKGLECNIKRKYKFNKINLI